MSTRLEALLRSGVDERVFPLARAAVWHQGKPVFEGGNASPAARFDLASLTKVMATSPLILAAERLGLLETSDRVGRFFPNAAAADATLEDLVFHRSGLPAFKPFFASASPVLEQVLATPRTVPPHTQAIYSDLGFILLGAIAEQVWKLPLDEAFETHVARPLRLQAGFRRVSKTLPPDDCVETGSLRPRPPAPGQEGLWSLPQVPSRLGDVDDDNAFALDGVSGHAGLFGTADDVARFGQAVLEGAVAAPSRWAVDALTKGSTRTFAFDTPGTEAPSCGARFGNGPKGAIGHTGFTGTSLWVDFDRQLVAVLLTNRVALGRGNIAIRAFRPRFHDAIIDTWGP